MTIYDFDMEQFEEDEEDSFSDDLCSYTDVMSDFEDK